ATVIFTIVPCIGDMSAFPLSAADWPRLAADRRAGAVPDEAPEAPASPPAPPAWAARAADPRGGPLPDEAPEAPEPHPAGSDTSSRLPPTSTTTVSRGGASLSTGDGSAKGGTGPAHP